MIQPPVKKRYYSSHLDDHKFFYLLSYVVYETTSLGTLGLKCLLHNTTLEAFSKKPWP